MLAKDDYITGNEFLVKLEIWLRQLQQQENESATTAVSVVGYVRI